MRFIQQTFPTSTSIQAPPTEIQNITGYLNNLPTSETLPSFVYPKRTDSQTFQLMMQSYGMQQKRKSDEEPSTSTQKKSKTSETETSEISGNEFGNPADNTSV